VLEPPVQPAFGVVAGRGPVDQPQVLSGDPRRGDPSIAVAALTSSCTWGLLDSCPSHHES
jgi:hypothetical protein